MILFICSAILFALILVPLSCVGYALGDLNKIGEGFSTFDYDEMIEKNMEEIEKEKHKQSVFNKAIDFYKDAII